MLPISETIVALATPPGRSGIGVIRLSGARSTEIAQHLIGEDQFKLEPNRATLKSLRDPATGEVFDTAILTFFKAPHSFTGEDVVEISCHGSPLVLRQIINFVLELNARPAGPGEFTLRALANGRLNLSQAEAIRDLINAQTQTAARQAMRQLKGELSLQLQPMKDTLLEIIVPLESALEFVEDDLPDVALDDIHAKLTKLTDSLEKLTATFRLGHLLRDGLKVAFVGRPNVGKSSLFNSLLGRNRAIVTNIPGTTRDSLSETVNIAGVPILLTDTAGVRVSTDEIETLGVERTRSAVADADLIIVVIDGSSALTEEDQKILAEVAELTHVIAVNKCDLESYKQERMSASEIIRRSVVSVSAKTGAGLDSLRDAILEPFHLETHDGGLLITDARHYDLLRRACDQLYSSSQLLRQRASEEIILVGLYEALKYLGEITGETTPEDVLSQIFATFCIGK